MYACAADGTQTAQTERGAAQLLKMAAAASMPNGEGSEPVRHELMSDALLQLACAREAIMQQATAACDRPSESSGSTSSTERASLLNWLASSAPVTSTSAWNAAERVHASLSEQLSTMKVPLVVGAGDRTSQVHRSQVHRPWPIFTIKPASHALQVCDALLAERLDESVALLAESSQERSQKSGYADARSMLWTRVHCAARLLEMTGWLEDVDAPAANAAKASLASAIATLDGNGKHIMANDATGLVREAARVLLQYEASKTSSVVEKAQENAALVARSSNVHEVMCVLALALHHERSTASHAPGAPHAASTLLVRTTDRPASIRSFFTSFTGGSHLRRLDPHGWFSDAQGRLVERAPRALCDVLWPPSCAGARVPGDTAKTWSERLLPAFRSLAISLTHQLSKHAVMDADRCAEAAGILLIVLRTIIPQRRPMSHPCILSEDDTEALLVGTAQALQALPSKSVPALNPALLSSLLLLLSPSSPTISLATRRELHKLIPQLSLDLAALSAGGHSLVMPANVLARLLPLSNPSPTMISAAKGLVEVVLGGRAHSAQLVTILPSLLALVKEPMIASELVNAGMVMPSPTCTA